MAIGRGLNYPTARDIKVKRAILYSCDRLSSRQLKHGPIALIDEDLPVVCIAPKTSTYEKMISNIQEVKARVAIDYDCTEGDDVASEIADDVIFVPDSSDELSPL